MISSKELKESFFNNINKNIKFYFVSLNSEIALESYKSKYFRKILDSSYINFPDGIGVVGAWFFKSLFQKDPVDSPGETIIAWRSVSPKKSPCRLDLYDTFLKQPFKRTIKFCIKVVNFFYFYWFLLRNIRQLSKKRITGVDFFLDLIQDKRINKYKIFLIGGKKGILNIVKIELLKYNKYLNIVGIIDGIQFKMKNTETENEDGKIGIENLTLAIREMKKVNPDIAFVCLGHPKQEYFVAKILQSVKSLKFSMGLGGTFDYIAHKSIRSPKILQSMGLEWLWRVIIEPKRIQRIWRAVVVFPWEITR